MNINWKPNYIPGDLVYNHKGEVVRITSSYLKGTRLFYYKTDKIGESTGCILEEALKPIPLTPEIIEKNGWEFYHGFYCSPPEKGAGICLSSRTGYVWNAHIAGHTLRSDINSVSDLQHLLFGLGLNSEMEV